MDVGRAIEFALKTRARFAAAATESNLEIIHILEDQMRDANTRQHMAQQAFKEHRATHIKASSELKCIIEP